MALFDNPPQVDPATGRLPSYKQVLQQDPATGTYKIKYEYTPITSSSTQGETLQNMLTSPVTDFANMGIGGGTGGGTGGDSGNQGDTGGGTGGGANNNMGSATTTGGGGRGRDDRFTPAADTRNALQKQLDTAYPTLLERGVGFVGTRLAAGVNPLLGIGASKFLSNNREKAIEDINKSIEDGTFLIGFSSEQIAKALEDNSNLPDNVADYMRNAISNTVFPTKMPTQSQAQTSTKPAPTTFQGITQDYLDSLPDTPMGGPNVRGPEVFPTKMPTIQERMDLAKSKVARRGGSRDKGEEASTQAFNDATSGFKYDGESRTSFEGTPQETTLVGTFSERRAKEEEGRNEDGTTQPGSIAELRDIAGQQTQPKDREVDKSNPVSNKSGKNEVGDKNGNAVTNNGKAINFGPGTKAYERMQEKREGNKGGDKKGRIICSELYKQNLISKEDYMLDLYYTSKHLTEQHTAGYWYFAVPAVKAMRRSKFWTAFWKEIAYNRLQDIKWRLGKGKFNLRGRIYSTIFEPFCYISGYFTPNSNYNKLYEGEI